MELQDLHAFKHMPPRDTVVSKMTFVFWIGMLRKIGDCLSVRRVGGGGDSK